MNIIAVRLASGFPSMRIHMKKSSRTSPRGPRKRAAAPTQAPQGEEVGRYGSAFSQVELGKRLRDTRKLSDLTLQQLSRLCGYSVTHLSQVERGHACPTIGALRRITTALGRDVRSFLETSPLPETSLVRRNERRTLELDPSRLTVELLTGRIPGGEISASLHTVKPSPNREPPRPNMDPHDRSIVVLKGRVEMVLNGRPQTCEPGEAVYLGGGVPCAFRNLEKEPAELLVVSLGSGI